MVSQELPDETRDEICHMLFVCQLLALPSVIGPSHTSVQAPPVYRLGPRRVERVRCQGVVVSLGSTVESKGQSFLIDDGTGVIETRPSSPSVTEDFRIGQLVDVVGRIGEALPADGKGGRRRVIEAEKVCLALDPDMESLRLIEPTSLYRHYCTRKQLPNAAPEERSRPTPPDHVEDEVAARVLEAMSKAPQGGLTLSEIESSVAAGEGGERCVVWAVVERLQVEGSIYRTQDGAYHLL